MSAQILRNVGAASSLQPQTSSVSASNPYTGEVIAPTDADSVQSAPNMSASNLKNVETCHIRVVLSGVGLKLKTGWLDQCVAELERSVSDFWDSDLTEKARRCLEKVLLSDMKSCGGGVLPENVYSMYSDELAGPFVLQVDEIFDDTGCPVNQRYAFMTDGVQRAVGKDISPDHLPVLPATYSPPPTPTLKIVVSNVQVQRGILLLHPATVKVLEVEDALKHVVEVLKTKRVQLGISLFTPENVERLKEMEEARKLMVQTQKRKGPDLETPSTDMTYFAELSQKWARIKDTATDPDHKLQGPIMFRITGVKSFGFSNEYEVVCYANDGVLDCCEIEIHNGVVETFIGHSAEYVAQAYLFSESTELIASIKRKLRHCRMFLAGFQGSMVVEMNKSSQYPVAVKILYR